MTSEVVVGTVVMFRSVKLTDSGLDSCSGIQNHLFFKLAIPGLFLLFLFFPPKNTESKLYTSTGLELGSTE